MPLSRRGLLRDGARILAAASLPGSAVAALGAGKDKKDDRARVDARAIAVRDIAGLAVFSGAGGNVVALGAPEGALMIDGGLAVNSAMLLKAVRERLKTRRIQVLINTHWHPEQTGANEAVGAGGGTIISHEVTRLALCARQPSALYKGLYGPLPAKARPVKTTYNADSLEFAGERVEYRYLPGAHTNGDLFVHFPRRNVLVAGGPVSAARWPTLDYLNGAFMPASCAPTRSLPRL